MPQPAVTTTTTTTTTKTRRSTRLSQTRQSDPVNTTTSDASTHQSFPSVSDTPKPLRKRQRSRISNSRDQHDTINTDPQCSDRVNETDKPSVKKQRRSTSKTTAPTVQNNETNVVSDSTKPSAPCGPPIYPECHVNIPFLSNYRHTHTHMIRLVTWNVASLRSVLRTGALQSYLQRERPHLLCIQETKMTEDAVQQVQLPEHYNVHWYHSERKGYSGLALFTRDDLENDDHDDDDNDDEDNHNNNNNNNSHNNSIKMKVQSIDRGMDDTTADSEGRVMTIRLGIKKKRIAIVIAYVPNAGAKLARLSYRVEQFEPKLREFLQTLRSETSVIYCGDLNVAHEEIDIHNSKANVKSAGHTPQEREQFGLLLQHGSQWVDCYRQLHPAFPGYTYYSRRFGTRLREAGKGWRLDYFVMDKNTFEKQPVIDCFVRPAVQGSDHYPLVLDLDTSKL